MHVLHFSTDFDGPVHHAHAPAAGEVFMGEKSLLRFLETHLGLAGWPENTDYLRIELYRQALGQHLAENPGAFFARSFEADRFAAAAALLAWRDELLLAAWDFSEPRPAPPRLRSLAAVEVSFQKKMAEPPANVQAMGFADRFAAVKTHLSLRSAPVEKIVLHEPMELLPVHIQHVVKLFLEKNVPVGNPGVFAGANFNSNLGRVQQRLLGRPVEQKPAAADGSLLLLRARRDADAAVFLAQVLGKNRSLKPVFVAPEMGLTLEQALVQEGFPAMGILSASSARPSLQVLKLAPAFLWEPVDVFKIMEFVTLPLKPLDDGLALEIARVLASKPGLFNDAWFATVFGHLENPDVPDEARKQYEFWFERRRYPADKVAPKRDIINIYHFLREWAVEFFEKSSTKNPSLLVLAEQARRIRDLLEAIPETRLSFLELERIVRTIYQPAPVQFSAPEKKHFGFVHSPGAFAEPTECVVWWNCTSNDPAPMPDKWTAAERQYLENEGVVLDFPKKRTDRNLLARNRAVFAAGQQLVLVVPEFIAGKAVQPNLILGDIEAAFEDSHTFSFDLESEKSRAALKKWVRLPPEILLAPRLVDRPKPLLPLARPEALPQTEYETLTSLETLFYYPHRWFFRQKMRLFPASLLSVTGDQTLLGSLAHRFFELLLKENFHDWDRPTVQDWIFEKSKTLLEREGATLLLYGREPERNQFLHRVQNAAWSLLSLLKSNGWEVEATEQDLAGHFSGVPVKGKADLVLRRDRELAIVDLKWGGAKHRKEMIRNGEDLQLVLYSKLLPPPETWPHTAYFILEDGKMVARNNRAFREALTGSQAGDEDHSAANELIFNKMERTFAWRMAQIRKGLLEIRTAQTASELEFLYAGELFDLLEMKNEDSRWDDYRTLIGL